MACRTGKETEHVLYLVNITLQVEYGGLNGKMRGFELCHACFGCQTCGFHAADRSDRPVPDGGLLRHFELCVQHEQRVVGLCHSLSASATFGGSPTVLSSTRRRSPPSSSE